MRDLLIGNLCSLLGMATDSIGSTRKTAKGVLLMQALSQAIYCIGSIVLRGYSASVQNAVSVIRNLVATRDNRHKSVEWILIILGLVLGLCFNNRGLFGLLPIIANLEYSLAVFRFKDNERALKAAFSASILMYAAFNALILNLVGVLSNIVVLIMTLVFLVKDAKTSK